MGKAKKEHRKKVARRNQQVKAAYRKAEAAVRQFIEQSQKTPEEPKYITLPGGPQSAIDVALAEKNKLATK